MSQLSKSLSLPAITMTSVNPFTTLMNLPLYHVPVPLPVQRSSTANPFIIAPKKENIFIRSSTSTNPFTRICDTSSNPFISRPCSSTTSVDLICNPFTRHQPVEFLNNPFTRSIVVAPKKEEIQSSTLKTISLSTNPFASSQPASTNIFTNYPIQKGYFTSCPPPLTSINPFLRSQHLSPVPSRKRKYPFSPVKRSVKRRRLL